MKVKTAAWSALKKAYNGLRTPLFRMRGYKLLNQQDTEALLNSYCVNTLPGNAAILPGVMNAGDPQVPIFQTKRVSSEPLFVWKYEHNNYKATLSKYGSVIIRGNVLCTDWSVHSFYKDIWKPDTRTTKHVPALIPLFSQHQDGIFYGGYYDYLFHIVAKLCRIKDTFPDEDYSNLFISYPIFKTAYEREFLKLLEIDTDKVIDSRECKPVTPQLITGNSAHWYPNLHDISSLKRHIGEKVEIIKGTGERVYISRSGRRKVVNETELIELLKKFGFTIIEDIPRSISEQISIYYNASFIIGPHGASFSNIIWCRPGAHLIELFSPNYMPDFFLYLSTVMGLHYSAHFDGIADKSVEYVAGLVEDIHVSIPKLELFLNEILGPIEHQSKVN
jgi:hypothetical protein